MAITGTLTAESLAADVVIDVPLTLRRLHRITPFSAADDQPGQWTLIDFLRRG